MAQRELAGVTHLVSTVEGTLRPDVGLGEILAATFPGGSVTGAPKIAALDLIAALEPVGRGASMGALGVVRPERRLRARADDPHARRRRGPHPPLGRRRHRLGLRPRGRDRGVVGQGAAAARRASAGWCRHDRAARGRGRRQGPRRSRRSRSSTPTTRRCSAAPPRSRPCASAAAGPCSSAATSSGSRGSCLALRLPPPDGVDGARARRPSSAAGTDEGALRLFRTGMTLLATVAPLPPGLEELRAARASPSSPSARTSAGLLTGVKATSYATALAAIAEAERRGADDAIYLGEGETVLEATMSNVWWREGDVLVTPVALDRRAAGRHPRRRRGARAAAPATAIREGSFTLPALLRADEAFTSSAVREIMPVIAVDGRELPRGDAAPRLQALLEQVDRRLPWLDG